VIWSEAALGTDLGSSSKYSIRTLKFEARKGSTRTAIVCGLVDPNVQRNCLNSLRIGGILITSQLTERESG